MILKLNIPQSWSVVRLGDFVENEKGKKPKNQQEKKDERFCYPYIDIEAFENNVIKSYADGENCRFCSSDDFLMVWDGSRSGLVGKGMNGALGSTLVRVNFSGILNDYAYYFLKSKYLQLNSRARGSGTPHVDPDLLWNYSFPIPPYQEQHHIVAKIEELFSELDKGVESLKQAREQLEVYRQALLKQAFEGKLTEQWRKENADKLETADQLLDRIKHEREARYQQQVEEWKTAVEQWEKDGKVGKKPSKPKIPKKLGEFSCDELRQFSALPDGWQWVKFDKISEHDQYAIKAGPFGSALKKEHYSKTGYKVYGQEQVISGDPYYGDYFIPEKKYKELITCRIKPGDILISLVGTVGKVLLLPNDCPQGIINPRLIKVSANTKYYNPNFFKYYFESLYVKSLYKLQTHGATMDVLNLGIIQSLPFPFCSFEEQQEIVDKLESILSVVNQNDTEIESQIAKSEALRQSILKKAFSGQLVPQDPNDEPASVLLERIAREKVDAAATAKKGRKVKKTQIV